MSRQHYYKGLDESGDHDLAVSIDMRKLAEQVDQLTYGTQRLLSHLVDVRREALAKRVAKYRERGDHDVADGAAARGDRLAEAIAKLLDEGEF